MNSEKAFLKKIKMKKGWVKIHRKMMDSDLWISEKFTRGQAWIDLILLANHKKGFIRARGVKIDVERGQVGHSVVALSKRWGWSRGKTTRFLNELESEQQIEQQKNNISSLITVSNYEEYQVNDTADDTTNGQQTDSKQYTNKNDKNKKNINNNRNIYTVEAFKMPDDVYSKLCEWFYENLLKLGKIKKSQNWKTKSWYDGFRLLIERDHVDYDNEFSPVMSFYIQSIGKDYCPEAFSPKSFRSKWIQIKNFYERQEYKINKQPQGRMNP